MAVLHARDGQIHCRVRTGVAADALAAAREALLRLAPSTKGQGARDALEQRFGGRAYGGDVFVRRAPPPRVRPAERALHAPGAPPIDEAEPAASGELRRVEGPIPPDLADVARRLLAERRGKSLSRSRRRGP